FAAYRYLRRRQHLPRSAFPGHDEGFRPARRRIDQHVIDLGEYALTFPQRQVEQLPAGDAIINLRGGRVLHIRAVTPETDDNTVLRGAQLNVRPVESRQRIAAAAGV